MKYVLVLAVFLFIDVGTVAAQSGVCPDHTNSLGYVGGFWPNLQACDDGGQNSELVFAPAMPCETGVRTRHAYVGEQPGLYIVFPAGQTFPTSTAKLEFFATGIDVLGRRRNLDLGFIIESFNGTGVKIGEKVLTEADAEQIQLPNGEWVYHFPERVTGQQITIPAVSGGYLIVRENSINWGQGWELFGMTVSDLGGFAPPACDAEIPDYATATPTPTPTPSHTPPGNPTATATITPTLTATPWSFPTVTPVTQTPTPWPTPTPQPLFTMPVPPTPTALGTLVLSTLESPDTNLPGVVGGIDTPEPIGVGLTPNATTEARIDDIATTAAEGHAIATRWYTSTNEALGWMGTDITNTTGISTPVEIAGELTGDLTAPIRYAKAVQIYIPNLWPIILFLLLATIWIFFILIVKFGLALVSDSMEILRKLIELIPGM